jgi:hypothetical protein
MIRRILICAFVLACVEYASGAAIAATWRGHTVKAMFTGQIDASPCPDSSCVRGVVTILVDDQDVRDHVVRCAWPHPRILDFSRRGYPHRHYALVHACGQNHWWRFR